MKYKPAKTISACQEKMVWSIGPIYQCSVLGCYFSGRDPKASAILKRLKFKNYFPLNKRRIRKPERFETKFP